MKFAWLLAEGKWSAALVRGIGLLGRLRQESKAMGLSDTGEEIDV
ncbi:MAG: hypothetical protein P4N59_28460 [Negativicutes bacterium]|nr:hypothetical protein [Negativicutes bacterium]